MSYYEKYVKNYQKTPKGKFITQRANAKRRGVDWQLTFEQWWEIWEKSGKWGQRGTDAKQYCMCRKHYLGPYSVDNVEIKTMMSNSSYVMKRYHHKIN